MPHRQKHQPTASEPGTGARRRARGQRRASSSTGHPRRPRGGEGAGDASLCTGSSDAAQWARRRLGPAAQHEVVNDASSSPPRTAKSVMRCQGSDRTSPYDGPGRGVVLSPVGARGGGGPRRPATF